MGGISTIGRFNSIDLGMFPTRMSLAIPTGIARPSPKSFPNFSSLQNG